MLLDTINIESQDIVKNIYIDNLLFVALRNPSLYDEDQEGGNKSRSTFMCHGNSSFYPNLCPIEKNSSK